MSKIIKKEPDGPISVKYPCNNPIKSSGKFSPTAIKNCSHDCDTCGFNPEESNRRFSEGKMVTDPKTGITNLVFPKKIEKELVDEFEAIENI